VSRRSLGGYVDHRSENGCMNVGARQLELRPRAPVMSRSRGLFLGGIRLRCSTRWRASELDRHLAAGADPMQSDELSLRVGQLGSSRSRRRIACALRAAVALAEGHAYPVTLAAPPIGRAAVGASGGLLLEIAERLLSGEPVGIQGVAIASQLIEDRRGPLYRDDAARPLSVTAFDALAALDRGLRTISQETT
jgi:hypothetical protein